MQQISNDNKKCGCAPPCFIRQEAGCRQALCIGSLVNNVYRREGWPVKSVLKK